ncbi:tegument protein [Porcine lymphotropic herpesvirus 3]|uniref:Tegument protein n=1 Tax=Suid gammaherpesvirus 5 TaxID=1960251 RepID=Q8B402_9GAMA|nr:tegument protein [Porcine lymphotropic herpesvirus 3]AAO12323.1 tegument protein [Porcine lymphotropic herpesvirus 3]
MHGRMQAYEDPSYLIRVIKKWPKGSSLWSPSPKHYLSIKPESLQRAKKAAMLYRNQLQNRQLNFIKAELIKTELANMVDAHLKNTSDIHHDLNQLKELTNRLTTESAGREDYSEPQSHEEGISHSDKDNQVSDVAQVYTIMIAPGDSGFTFVKNLREEFLASLYTSPNIWLPSYGPWYASMTANAMQRRVFPKELRGSINFKHSTSLKLMTEVLNTVASANVDFYTDERHLSDFCAGLTIINAYFCKRTSASIPRDVSGLLENLGSKIDLLITDLKNLAPAGNFKFTIASNLHKTVIAPLGNDSKYSKDFFTGHKLYNLLLKSNVIFMPDRIHTPGAVDGLDLMYAITSTIFSENIPPFLSYQFNLRIGIKAAEYMIIVYLILSNAQISIPDNRRLNLLTLLGSSFSQRDLKQTIFKKGQLFSFLVNQYVLPMLKFNPNISTSELFPGLVLVALETGDILSSDPERHFVNLAGTKYNKIFNIINHKMLFKDARELLRVKAELRVSLEEGLASIMSSVSPITTVSDVIKTQFGGGDDYDRLYFLVFACLPVSTAVI